MRGHPSQVAFTVEYRAILAASAITRMGLYRGRLQIPAVLSAPAGGLAVGAARIREVHEKLLADRPRFSGDVRPALQHGDLALTSTRFQGGATAEIARRQPDGTWLWVADQPNIAG
jgi:hypothetical protein